MAFFLASLSIAVVYYIVFALIFSTDTESRLERENQMLEDMLPELEQKEALLSDVVTNLELRDNRIYAEIFQTAAPDVDPVSSLEFLHGMDTIPDDRLVKATADKLESLTSRAQTVEENFRQITALMPFFCAPSATPCAWLPAEQAITPRARSSSVSLDIL